MCFTRRNRLWRRLSACTRESIEHHPKNTLKVAAEKHVELTNRPRAEKLMRRQDKVWAENIDPLCLWEHHDQGMAEYWFFGQIQEALQD